MYVETVVLMSKVNPGVHLITIVYKVIKIKINDFQALVCKYQNILTMNMYGDIVSLEGLEYLTAGGAAYEKE